MPCPRPAVVIRLMTRRNVLSTVIYVEVCNAANLSLVNNPGLSDRIMTNRVNWNIDFLSAEVSVRFLLSHQCHQSTTIRIESNCVFLQKITHPDGRAYPAWNLGHKNSRASYWISVSKEIHRSEAPIQSYKKQIPYLWNKYACPWLAPTRYPDMNRATSLLQNGARNQGLKCKSIQ